MGRSNCLPKLKKKNKVCPDARVSVSKTRELYVFGILSGSSASPRMPNRSSRPGSCEAELEMVRELTMSDLDSRTSSDEEACIFPSGLCSR